MVKIIGLENIPYKAVPAGTYAMVVKGSQKKKTKKGGTMIVFEYMIIYGDHAGRKIFDVFNIVNKNPDAETFSRHRLKQLSDACELPCPPDDDAMADLHDKTFTGTLSVDHGAPSGYANKVHRYGILNSRHIEVLKKNT